MDGCMCTKCNSLRRCEKDIAVGVLVTLLGEIAEVPFKRGRFWYLSMPYDNDEPKWEIRLSAEEARLVTKIMNQKGK